MKNSLLALVFSLSTGAVYAADAAKPGEPQPLHGVFSIGGAGFDEPDGAPDDTNMYFRLDGAAAKKMYAMIKTKAEKYDCSPVPVMRKASGSITCYFSVSDKKYNCYFSIGVKTNKLGYGEIC